MTTDNPLTADNPHGFRSIVAVAFHNYRGDDKVEAAKAAVEMLTMWVEGMERHRDGEKG
jgi:hypothetical protein